MRKLAGALVCSIAMLGAHAEQTTTKETRSVEAATFATITLAKAMCGENANLDKATVQANSSAFAIFAAAAAATGDIPKNFIERYIPAMFCDEEGLLHVDIDLG